MTEQMNLYFAIIVTLTFLSGCFLIVLSVREQLEKRGRERSWYGLSPGAPQKVTRNEAHNTSRSHSGIGNCRFVA